MLNGPQTFSKRSNNATPLQNLIVFLHGYGANGDDLIAIAQDWHSLEDTLFVSPNAIEPCEMSPLGYQWFGLRDFDIQNMRSGLEKAAPILKEFIQDQLLKHQLSEQQLILVGFSQGTMMALEMLMHFPNMCAVVGYSGAFYPPNIQNTSTQTPIFLGHGRMDTVVPITALHQAEKDLKQRGYTVCSQIYEHLMHGISMQGLQDGLKFIQTHMGKHI